MNSIIQAVT